MDDAGFASRKAFLNEMEPYFERNEAQTALSLAQSRLEKIPGDLAARIVICRAWLIEGRIDKTAEMLAEIKEILAVLSRLYDSIEDPYGKKGPEKEAEMIDRKSGAAEPETSPSPDMGKPDTLEEPPREELPPEELPPEESAAVEENNDESEGNAEMPPAFETVTVAELYMRQGHYQMAQDLLVKIIARDAANASAARLLEDVRDRLAQENVHRRNGEIVKELSAWLDNMGSLSRNA